MTDKQAMRALNNLWEEWGGHTPPFHWSREDQRIGWAKHTELEAYLPEPSVEPLPQHP